MKTKTNQTLNQFFIRTRPWVAYVYFNVAREQSWISNNPGNQAVWGINNDLYIFIFIQME